MASVKLAYGTSTAITITLNSLASAVGSARESLVVSAQSTDLNLDAMVYVAAELITGTPASDKQVNVYAYGSEDGTNYTDNATGADTTLTLRSPTNLRLMGVIAMPDSGGLQYKGGPWSVASAFGGILPRKWGIVVENRTSLAFESSGCSASYTGVYATVA